VADLKTDLSGPADPGGVNSMRIVLLLVALQLQSQNPSSLSDVMVRSESERDQTSLCGPLSMARLMSLQGRNVQFNQFLERFDRRTAEGVQLAEMIAIGDEISFPLQAVEFTSRDLTEITLPGILIVDGDAHCLVLEAVGENTVTVWDPSSMMPMTLPASLIAGKWSGKALITVQGGNHILPFSLGGALLCFGLHLLWRSARCGVSNAK
jgi:hypothetical protein